MGICKPIDDLVNTIQGCPKLKLTILEIYWLGSYKVAKQGKTVEPTTVGSKTPYWESGKENEDTIKNDGEFLYYNLPKNSAVYSYLKTPKPQLKVKLKLEGDSGGQFTQDYPGKQATLEMFLGGFIFLGDFIFPSEGNEIDVIIELNKDLDCINRIIDDAQWTVKAKINGNDVVKTLKDKTKLEFFSIYDQPAGFYNNDKGVWVEVLRFLFNKIVNLQAESDKLESAVKISSCCFYSLNLKYDTIRGESFFLDQPSRGKVFRLRGYLLNCYTQGMTVEKGFFTRNCHDQACIIEVLSGALGIKVDWIYMDPFGYIKKTKLLGVVDDCNNPFFKGYGTDPLETDINRRTSFGNHSFIKVSDKIIDACAGPHLATETLVEYARASIEYKTDKSPFSTVTDAEINRWWSTMGITIVNWELERLP